MAAPDARADSRRWRHSRKNRTQARAPNAEHARCEVSGFASPRASFESALTPSRSARPGRCGSDVPIGYVEYDLAVGAARQVLRPRLRDRDRGALHQALRDHVLDVRVAPRRLAARRQEVHRERRHEDRASEACVERSAVAHDGVVIPARARHAGRGDRDTPRRRCCSRSRRPRPRLAIVTSRAACAPTSGGRSRWRPAARSRSRRSSTRSRVGVRGVDVDLEQAAAGRADRDAGARCCGSCSPARWPRRWSARGSCARGSIRSAATEPGLFVPSPLDGGSGRGVPRVWAAVATCAVAGARGPARRGVGDGAVQGAAADRGR